MAIMLQPPLLLRTLVLPVQYSDLSTGVLTAHGSNRMAPLELLTAVGTKSETQGPTPHSSEKAVLKHLLEGHYSHL